MLTEQQLEARKEGIGGSDAPTICGVNPYQQPLELYHEKRGEWDPDDLSDNQAVHFGNLLEDMVAEEWALRSARKVRRDNRTIAHPDHPWMLGHIDRRVTGVDEGLECKNRGWFMAKQYGDEGTDQVLEPDLIQCQHYMAVTGWERWHLAVYFGGADFRIFSIDRDEALIADLIAIEGRFWQGVLDGAEPGIDMDHPRADALLDRLYPGTDGTIMTLPDNAEYWHKVAQEAAVEEKSYREAKDSARRHLRHLMGQAAVGKLPDGTLYSQKMTPVKAEKEPRAAFIKRDFRHVATKKTIDKLLGAAA